jgi:putative DNA-invertase from lambdoid prophage Rac
MARTFLYVRVSTAGQTTENQIAEVKAAGFAVQPSRVITETISGSTLAMQRPAFHRLVDRLEADDVLVVTKLDRLGRNAMDVRTTVDTLAALGVRVHCLALGGGDLTSSAGRMTMQVIAAVAEFERDLLVERTQSGLARARKEGKMLGRPASLTEAQKRLIVAQLDAGGTVSALAREFGTSRQTIMRARSGLAS